MKMALAATEIECFRTLVTQRFGLYFDEPRLDFLADVVRQRMEATGCDLFSSYQRRIASSAGEPDELRALAERLTVNETYFFRYADHFRAFAEVVVPERIQARGLTTGCEFSPRDVHREKKRIPSRSSFEPNFRNLRRGTSKFMGSTSRPRWCSKAIRARYSAWSLRDTPADLQTTYFRPDGRDFLLDATIRPLVTFEERNLTEDDPLFWLSDAFDVVFCRNVTMYFTSEVTRSVIARIARSTAPGGFLFLGHAENLRGVSQSFHLRHTHETFYYQRREAHETDSTVDCAHAPSDNESTRSHVSAARSNPATPGSTSSGGHPSASQT
jgi:chemotaxis protein methyltransferase CheR